MVNRTGLFGSAVERQQALSLPDRLPGRARRPRTSLLLIVAGLVFVLAACANSGGASSVDSGDDGGDAADGDVADGDVADSDGPTGLDSDATVPTTGDDASDSSFDEDEPFCETDEDCPFGNCVVIDNASGVGVCTYICLNDADCPEDWTCQIIVGGVEGRYCLPRSLCIDNDGDGYGIGPDCLGPDCDDDDATVYPGAPSRCDGQDNNCNGLIDDFPTFGEFAGEEVVINDDCVTGFGGLCDEGRWACLNGETICNPRRPAGVSEVCNGIDDTCDGLVDEIVDEDGEVVPLSRECYSGPEGTAGVGECRGGLQICTDGDWGSACVGEVTPQPEVCDGRDNSCSGAIDDNPTDVGTPCEVPGLSGACAVGVWECNEGERVCVQTVFPEATESCNGRDDTCDGVVDGTLDENGETVPVTRPCYTGPDGTEGVGECRAGVQVCTEGTFPVACVGEVIPQPEVCDGLDNSCDGEIDNNPSNIGAACEVPGVLGACAVGVWECSDGGRTCVQTVFPEATETCNGRDDTCDGVVDGTLDEDGEEVPVTRECYTGPDGTAGVGECRAGVQVCTEGTFPVACVGEVIPQPEVCDGRDNNCDGDVDNNPINVGGSCSTGLPGRCAAGTWTCSAAGERICQQNQEALPAETCNNQDDTCDGIVDGTPNDNGERIALTRPCYTGPDGTAGVGNCQAGTQTCNEGDWGNTCAGQVTPQPESCNGQDQSCNGTPDNPVPADAPLWYQDADGDGFGNPAVSVRACAQPAGYVSNNLDCDDGNAFINPNAAPRCDGIRNNCQPGTEQHGCPAGCTGIYNATFQRGYMFCQAGGRNWTTARAVCQGQSGMDLVSIHSTAEHNWVLASTPWNWGELWIGGIQTVANAHVYGWVNGAAWNYNTGWAAGEPNNLSETCVEMQRTRARADGSGAGAFNDNGCGRNRNELICGWTQWPQRP